MAITQLAETIRHGLAGGGFADSLKFDCGPAGVICLSGGEVSLDDMPADCTLRMSIENLEKIIAGKLNPMTALMMGKIRVSGDPTIAMKLGKLLKG